MFETTCIYVAECSHFCRSPESVILMVWRLCLTVYLPFHANLLNHLPSS